MTLAIVHTRASLGVKAPEVTVETHLSNGLPKLNIVGLPEAVVKESKDRVRSAILNSQFQFPNRHITVNLAPADLPKEGGRFDLPIAIGILAASKQIPAEALNLYEFAGELSLSGNLRAFSGAIPFAIGNSGKRKMIFPTLSAQDAALVPDSEIYAAEHLLAVCAHLNDRATLSQVCNTEPASTPKVDAPDMADIKGQPLARRALEIAAAGKHSLLMIGPPGTGKTMLASRLPSILPPLTVHEALEHAAIVSLVQGGGAHNWYVPPFRAPHHTASGVALVGGGSQPKPGEISLAHHGVLFLDELPEFDRKVLEVLREPLESGSITISRANRQAEFPAKFQLIAAMNPCPCGYLGDKERTCRCSGQQIARYQNKLSGPLLDRIDMHIEVAALPRGILTGHSAKAAETSQSIRQRVQQARKQQLTRQNTTNHALTPQEISRYCALAPKDAALLEQAMLQLQLSARAYHRILKVARTIADLDNSELINNSHVLEALSYRKHVGKA